MAGCFGLHQLHREIAPDAQVNDTTTVTIIACEVNPVYTSLAEGLNLNYDMTLPADLKSDNTQGTVLTA